MKMQISITVKSKSSISVDQSKIADDRFVFWRMYYERLDLDKEGEGPSFFISFEDFMFQQEAYLGFNFTTSLSALLRENIGYGWFIHLKVKSITYSSLNILLDIVTASFEKTGITPDDLIDLIEMYTPEALARSTVLKETDVTIGVNKIFFPPPVDNATVPPVMAAMPTMIIPPTMAVTPTVSAMPATTATAPAAADDATLGNTERTRSQRIWWISNMSLVLPAVILLGAAVFTFQSVQEERNKMIDALIKERVEIGLQREKIVDRYAETMKQFQESLAVQSKHFGELNSIEAKIIEDKSKDNKEKSSSRTAP